MNLGISEIFIVVIEVVIAIGIPVAIAWVVIVLFKRIKSLEVRVEKLESKQDTDRYK